jgi:hypothetical protein
MLAHSPPLPLLIDYSDYRALCDITTEDEQGAILALKQRDRVRRVHLRMSIRSLRKLIGAIDEEYPILEYLIVHPKDFGLISVLPETLQAPRLRHLVLGGIMIPIESRLLRTAVSLVTLYLAVIDPTAYFCPFNLLLWLSSMPRLETLVIFFLYPVSNEEVERLFAHKRIIAPRTLTNLHRFTFQGYSTYLEGLLHHIITPRLKRLRIILPDPVTLSVPLLQQFIDAAETLRFDRAKIKFSNGRVYVKAYPRGEAEIPALSINANCMLFEPVFDRQVSFAAQLSNSLSQTFSAVEHLTLERDRRSEELNDVLRIEWRNILCSFRNVKTLRIAHGIVEDLSLCLQLKDGELPLELLPELQELTYSTRDNTGDAFTSFIDARQKAGRPITLVRRSPSPDSGPNLPTSETSLITPVLAAWEARNYFDA